MPAPAVIWIGVFLAVFGGALWVATGGRGGDPMLWVALCGLGLLTILWLYGRSAEGRLLEILGRGVMVLLPLVLAGSVPAILILAAPVDVRIQQAALAGIIVALGWMTTFVFQEVRRAGERRDQEIDMLLAVRAEILNFAYKLRPEELDGRSFDQMIARIEEARARLGAPDGARAPEAEAGAGAWVFRSSRPEGKTETAAPAEADPILDPFIFSQAAPHILPALAGDLRPVDDLVGVRIVEFYAQLAEIREMISDMQSARFAALSAERRAAILIRLLEMQRMALSLALLAVEAIEKNVPQTRMKAIKEDAAVSRQTARGASQGRPGHAG